MNSLSKKKLWKKLQSKKYRDGYTEAQLSIEIPFQIRALREARGWTQTQLAERSGIPQARISHLEQAGRDPLSLRTLYRLASAFDVGLHVQFAAFSELVEREEAFHPETFQAVSFQKDRLQEAPAFPLNMYVQEKAEKAFTILAAEIVHSFHQLEPAHKILRVKRATYPQGRWGNFLRKTVPLKGALEPNRFVANTHFYTTREELTWLQKLGHEERREVSV